MAEKELGYVELEWTCKRCQTRNPGTQKTCTNCGAAREVSDQLELPAEQKLLSEEEAMKTAGRGPDIHCPFCNAPNRSDAKECEMCGGKLEGGQACQAGQVVGAYQSGPAAQVKCPACDSMNPANAPRCQNCGAALQREPAPQPAPAAQAPAKPNLVMIVVLALLGIVACIVLGSVFARGMRTSELSGVVQDVHWERSMQVLEQQPVQRETWQDEIPEGAPVGQCRNELRRVQDEPAPGAEEVCGTPYTVDQGSGVGKVVQDCQYRIYEPYCTYTADDWVVIDTLRLQGDDMNPQWPAYSFSGAQREGQTAESYQVVFSTATESYTYTTSDPQDFAQFTPGSQWVLEVNGFGAVTGLQAK